MKYFYLFMISICLVACKKNDDIKYYQPYTIEAEINCAKSNFTINGFNANRNYMRFYFGDRHSGDLAQLNLTCNPIILIDSTVTFDTLIKLNTSTLEYDTTINRLVYYKYDSTFFTVKYRINNETVFVDSGYSRGVFSYKPTWVVK